jgi:benzoate/toluate 1,2-dioxygenase reductase component
VEGVRGGEGAEHTASLAGRTWWSKSGFTLELERPSGFMFLPGQTLRIFRAAQGRDYSLASAPGAPRLEVCLRLVETGVLSPWLASAPMGTPITFNGPSGAFLFRRSERPAILAATGTGFAPFLSMVRAGLRGFTMLHGVREREELFAADSFRAAAALYVPCLSAGAGAGAAAGPADAGCFAGRVTTWIRDRLPAGTYDFYLCGGREMVRDVIAIVDERFRDSRVYTEIFY